MSSLSKTRSTVTGLAAAFLLAGSMLSPASAAVAGMRFSVRPDPSGSLSPRGDYFVLKTDPGKVARDSLQLSNPTSRPVEVRLAAVDGTTAQLGGVDYTPSGSPPDAAGSWIDLAKTSITLAAGEVETVAFTVAVPDDARSGVNLGGIAAWTPSEETSSEEEGAAASIEVQTRRVVAVQIELPGPADPLLEIDGVTAVARPDGIYLQVDIRNEGHGFAEGEGTLELPGESFSSVFPLDKVVPGTGVGYPIRWRAGAPADGAYPVTVEIHYGAGVAKYRGEVIVGGEVREELADRGIGGTEEGVSLLPVAAGAVFVVAAAATLSRRRRNERPASPPVVAATPPPPSPSAAPGAPETPARRVPPPPPPTRNGVGPAGPPPPPPVGARPRR
jgi:hypothetical protein